MRNLWKTLKLAILSAALLVGTASAFAEKNENLEDLSFAELVNSVNLGKQTDLVRKFQDKEATTVLLRNKAVGENSPCAIDAVRNKEVLVVTIPANLLFGPNQTELLETADKYLEPFKRYLKEPDLYRVLAVMHTDNTGSEAYREKITIDRAQAVADWFENNALDTSFFFPFAMADDIPLVPNDSYSNREKNRRLEIYLVPGEAMIEKAKKGRIAL
ncbi:MAG: OmpA family protein [Muribaculaceae bacterium]|nr:OmpA family protein [Muribaculaceae bacterium]